MGDDLRLSARAGLVPCELAVAVAGTRLTETGVLEPVPPEQFLKLKQQFLANPATTFTEAGRGGFAAIVTKS